MKKIIILAATMAIGGFAAIHSANATAYTITQIDVPGASGTMASGINNVGQIVGNTGGGAHGFLDTRGSFTQIDVPGASATVAIDINDPEQIVGYFDNSTGTHGYVDSTGGRFTQIDVPSASVFVPSGINNGGQIVGNTGMGGHGFLYTGGSFIPIDDPGASITQAFGINDAGQIVGFFNNSTGSHGFLATPVPEPVTLTLFCIGLAGLVGVMRRGLTKPC